MPRIAAPRPGTAPASDAQRERRGRILAAAEQLATTAPLERVQMQEVARSAGVAIGTLYRYFPSKTHLFVAVLLDQIDRLGETTSARPVPDVGPAEAALRVLLRAQRALLSSPSLAHALLQSANTADATVVPDVALVDRGFRQELLDAMGLDEPTDDDQVLIRLLLELWYGVLTSRLNNRISTEIAEADATRGCRLLLAHVSTADRRS